MGWTANTSQELKKGQLNGIKINDDALSWTGSLMTLGAFCVCIPIGKFCDIIGRKWASISTVVPFCIGWGLIIISRNVIMIYIGRFLLGIAGGAFCIAAPLYTSEIAQTEIRGTLGTFFQLLLVVGILYSYIAGCIMSVLLYTITCAAIPIAFFIVFFFQPETPVYLLRKEKDDQAKKSLQRLRGKDYNPDAEIADIKAAIAQEKQRQGKFFEVIKTKAAKKACLIVFSLMFFQQLSGINAVIFYTQTIFQSAGSKIDPRIATIIIGIFQVVATLASALVIDKLGRRLLLLISDGAMAFSTFLLGLYFCLLDRHLVSADTAKSLGWIPILALIVFIVAFSFGFGPVPWMIVPEIMPQEIKSTVGSIAGAFNWLLAFLVTRTYLPVKNAFGGDVTFFIFTSLSILGTVFVLFLVPETKGKTFEEIQKILGGEKEEK